MVLWGSCVWCDGCDDCGLVQVEVFVRIALGYGEKNVKEVNPVECGDTEEVEGIDSDGDEMFVDDPGRFVIYRRDGEAWVREWETSEYHLPPIYLEPVNVKMSDVNYQGHLVAKPNGI